MENAPPSLSVGRSDPFPDPSDVARSTAGWVRAMVGGPGVAVRVSLPDRAGRLRVQASSGTHRDEGRLRSTRRRQAFAEATPVKVVMGSPPERELHILPLVSEGEALGVVEVVGPAGRLAEREDALAAAIQQSALLLRAAADRAEVDRAMRGMASLFELTSQLMTADTPLDALRLGVDLCSEELRVPAAGIRPDRGGQGWYLAAAAGMGARRRSGFRSTAHRLMVHGRPEDVHASVAGAFADAVGWDRAEVVPTGEALMLVAGRSNGRQGFLSAVGSLVGEAMSHSGDLRTARSRIEGLDLGIAWTAHELRGPLIGASAALDHVLESVEGAGGNELLLRTRGELERLTELVGPLLRWSAGSELLDRRRVELGDIVREAVDACVLEHPDHRIVIDVTASVPVRADARQLSGAIANVLRNALAYSPTSAPVRIVVERDGERASVCISDRGPGIAPEERDLIFDPFARGAAGDGMRSGNGLGLFIARRVALAHGGALRLLPSRRGATFCFELAVASERRHASAS